MNISRLIVLLLNYYFSLVLTSRFDPEIIEIIGYNPTEPFLNVFLNIYDMYLKLPEHEERVKEILSQFEIDPFLLINDEICFPIVLEHIYLGFREEEHFFYCRSCRLLFRILMVRPGNAVLYKILQEAGPIERKGIIEIMIRSGSIPFIADVLKIRSLTLSSFESILMNKLRS